MAYKIYATYLIYAYIVLDIFKINDHFNLQITLLSKHYYSHGTADNTEMHNKGLAQSHPPGKEAAKMVTSSTTNMNST